MKRTASARFAPVLAGLVFVLVGCATIPDQTKPQPADLQGSGANAAVPALAPPKGDQPLAIVRGFVDYSGDPANYHAAARAYLADSAKATWNTSATVIIVGDIFSTTPEGDNPPNATTATVNLDAQQLGRLGGDGAFQPLAPGDATDVRWTVRVRRQADGGWRILNPPDHLLVKQTDFGRHYRQVFVYYFDPTLSVLVPDARYVAAEPSDGLPGRIIELLLGGPSSALVDAVSTAIPTEASLKTNVTESPDGTITVNLKAMPDQPANTKQLMIAQIVKSLQNYGSNVVVQSEGVALLPGHLDWRLADLPSYEPFVSSGLPSGLVVVRGRILSLNDGAAIAGPGGDGQYDVVSAAQSLDGTELAMVTADTAGGRVLRVTGGRIGTAADPVRDLRANSFTRPTWTPGDSIGDPSRAVWTVADGTVVRVVNNSLGSWVATPVDASTLAPFGQITDLRLSRDGVRVAVVAGGHVLVGAVVIDQGSVSIKQVRLLQTQTINQAVRVDWLRQDLLVVGTTQPGMPLASVSVDGQKLDQYNSSNLTSTVTAVAAAPSRPVLAVDAAGIWTSTDIADVWQPYPHNQPADAIPFYPG